MTFPDIAEAVTTSGFTGGKSQGIIDRPIKTTGVHSVRVSLHPEVSVGVKVNVARSPDEAELQAQGVNVIDAMFETETAGFTEAYDPNAEPGEIPADLLEGPAEGEVEA